MATDAERHRAFNAERERRERELGRIQRDTAVSLADQIAEAERRIAAQLAGDASDYTRWLSPQLQRSMRAVLDGLGASAGETLAAGAERAWDAGVAGVDAPLDAALGRDAPGVSVRDVLASVDRRQLEATRTWLTGKMRDVTAETARRVNTELGQVMLGVQTPSEAVTAIAERLGSDRRRGITIVRTELGRAYAHAGQARMAQARRSLPGLRKQWRRSGKTHERPGHVAMDGQIRDVDEPYQTPDGVELLYPRDPRGPAGETINCGCQSLPYMESWEQAGALRDAGARPYEGERPAVRDAAGEQAPVAEAGAGDGPVVVRTADPQPEFPIALTGPQFAALEGAGEVARAAIRRDAGSEGFARWAAGRTAAPGEERAVALLDGARATSLGWSDGARVVRLSAETVRTHPRFRALGPADWLRVQRIVDEGAVVERGARHRVAWIRDGGEPWAAVLKRTRHDEIYVVSYRRAREQQVKKWEA